MKKKYINIFIIILFILLCTLELKGANREISLEYSLFPKSDVKKGKIFFYNVIDSRKYDNKGFLKYKNIWLGEYGTANITSEEEIVIFVKKLITDALLSSGYEVISEKKDISEKCPVLKVEIIDFTIKGYWIYGMSIDIKISLYDFTEENEKFSKNIKVTAGFPDPIKLETMSLINIIFNKLSKESNVLFNSTEFNKSMQGEINIIENQIINFDNLKLKNIPNDLKNESIAISFYNNSIENIENLNNILNLEYLDLNFCLIKKIENLDKLNNLKYISADCNDILKIENIDKLYNLKELHLNSNKIKKIEGLGDLDLEYLTISNNKIIKMENMEKQINLKWLDLSYNKIEKIECLENKNKLGVLNLSDNNISQIENLDDASNLYYLDLSFNSISELKNLEKLKNLKYLIIFGNSIKTITQSSYDLLKNNNCIINNKIFTDWISKKKKIKIKAD